MPDRLCAGDINGGRFSKRIIRPSVYAGILLPESFIGRWDASLEACKATSDMKLIITQTELAFWESAGRISGVMVKAPDDVMVQADFSGEGEQWQRSLHLVLSADSQTLTINDGSIRIRCP